MKLSSGIRVGLAAMVVAAIATWSASCIAGSGIVLEKDTSKPIAGAHVVAAWHGVMVTPVQDRSICYHVEATTTDKDGRFEMSELSGNLNPILMNRSRDLWIFVPGYKKAPDAGMNPLRAFMEPESGTTSEQFKRLPFSYVMGCRIPDKKVLLPLLRALYPEAKRLASTPGELKSASGILFQIESLELGGEEAFRRANDRQKGAAMRGAP
jgi:hypothetical protein